MRSSDWSSDVCSSDLIHLAYCQAAGQDANELPYGNIVALNEHGAVLHYTELGRLPPKPVRSFLLDAGASHGGYASDITRMYSADTGNDFQSLDDAVDAAPLEMRSEEHTNELQSLMRISAAFISLQTTTDYPSTVAPLDTSTI